MLDSKSEPMLLVLAMGPVLFVKEFSARSTVWALLARDPTKTQTMERSEKTLGLRATHGPGHFLQNIVIAAS